ncbi:MAG: PKD domain-containing protein, partial [Tepidiformaceae bacterium]
AERIGYVSRGGAPSGAPLGLPGDAESGTHAAGSAPAMVDREDDSGLGPTLYEDLGITLRTRGRQISLTVAGFGLLAMGGALLVAAFFVGGDSDGGGNVAASDDRDPTATPTLVEQAAGVRTAAPNTPASQATSATAGAEPTTTPGASTTPTSAGGAVEPTATEGEPEPTPLVQATPTPASEPTASATATPSGPWVQVSGPTTAEVGEAVTFSASHSPDAIRLDWAASNGTSAPIVPAFTVTFGTAGCHSVTVTALFPEGARASTQVVAVGVESCGLG